MTVEQMCRDLLERAIKDGLVTGLDPQCLSAGDLVGVANLLNEYLFIALNRPNATELQPSEK